MDPVTSYRVTGEWRTLVGDTPIDPDPHPDAAKPTGNVRFTPTHHGPYLVGGDAYTLSPIVALIGAGHLRDLQGRDGVWLAARIGDQPITWIADITLSYLGHTSRDRITFTPIADTHLTALPRGTT